MVMIFVDVEWMQFQKSLEYQQRKSTKVLSSERIISWCCPDTVCDVIPLGHMEKKSSHDEQSVAARHLCHESFAHFRTCSSFTCYCPSSDKLSERLSDKDVPTHHSLTDWGFLPGVQTSGTACDEIPPQRRSRTMLVLGGVNKNKISVSRDFRKYSFIKMPTFPRKCVLFPVKRISVFKHI